MMIDNLMFMGIPSSIANVQSTNEGHSLIDKYYFFMMAPKKGNDEVIGMPHYFDIVASQRLKIFFNKLGIIVNCYFGLLINYDVYFNTFIS